MKKILFVYDRMMTGGTTTALLSLLNELDYSNYSVDLLLFDYEGEFLKSIPKQVNLLKPALKRSLIKGLKVSYRKIVRSIFSGAILKALLSYFKYRKTPKGNLRLILMHYGVFSQVAISRSIDKTYDVAIGFIEGWADHYVLSGKVRALKKIVWFHPDYQDSYLIPEVDKKSLKMATYIITVSKTCELHMKSVFPEYKAKILTIENIISKKYIERRSLENSPVIIKKKINLSTVARCDINVKGLDRIIKALSLLKTENLLEDVMWHYIGGGPEIETLKKMIECSGISEHVQLYGQVNNPLCYLKQMDAFVLASRYEGKPVAVEEALVMGIPCIVTEYASAREQIEDGKNGLIVENSDEGVYKGIKLFCDSERMRRSLINRTNTVVEDNTSEIDKLYELIRG